MQGKLGAFVVVALLGLGGILSFRVPQLQFLGATWPQVFGPLEQAVGDPVRAASGFVRTIEEMGRLRSENARLREEVGRLTSDTARLSELTRENDQLRDQLDLRRQQPSYQWLSARVIGRDARNLLRSVAIDHGTDDGLAVGMTVMAPAGLVGQIQSVTRNSARVLLITDVSSSVTAIVQSSRAQGVVDGQGKPYLQMKYIPQPAVVKTGDPVITSGVGGVFPNGLLIGRVSSVSKKDIEPFQEARIDPNVDFEHLEAVLVITNHVPLRLE